MKNIKLNKKKQKRNAMLHNPISRYAESDDFILPEVVLYLFTCILDRCNVIKYVVKVHGNVFKNVFVATTKNFPTVVHKDVLLANTFQ